ncbi:mov34/MPN/PAD-1 family protein [Ruminococcus sp. CAG:488]|nr:mov34/MPN/PAD-1 family protein [Ruminococcus sp. CAG:488]
MGKKAKKGKKKALQPELVGNALPQNIISVGDHVEENKNVYILQSVYKEIHRFTQNKNTNESGGMLVGTTLEEFGKTNIIILGFVEAKYCEATPTTLRFTHETWKYVHNEIEKKYPGKKIVGWIHTHPDFGIFLSEYDKFIHQNFFNEDYQVAYVVDPIQKIEGFYFWINEKIEKCRGFYIYDKTGAKITVEPDKEETASLKGSSAFSFRNILVAVLIVAVILLIFSNISMKKELSKLEERQKGLAEYAGYMQQLIGNQTDELQKIKKDLLEAGVITESSNTEQQKTTEDDASDKS